MLVDLNQKLCFPLEIATTNLRPALVLWSALLRHVYKLTVPWERSVDEAFEHKKLRYTELGANAKQQDWKVREAAEAS